MTDEQQIERLIGSIEALTSAVRALSLPPTTHTGAPTIASQGATSGVSWHPSDQGPPIHEMVSRYLAEREESGEWGDSHRDTVRHWLEHLTVFLGGPTTPIGEADRDALLRYRQHLVENPKRNGKERRAPSTVNTILIHLGAFFRWCRDTAGVIERDPTVKLKLKAVGKSRAPFTMDEVERVWRGMREEAPTPAHYWLPTICLYTGMRREEVAQLRVGDVAATCFDLRGLEKLKTSASARRVPIHDHLWDLGLGDLIQDRGEDFRIFGEWCPVKSNGLRSGAVGNWFNQRLRRLKLPASKVLHSTRHTVATQLKQLGAEDYVIAQILGHENPNITTGHYGHDVEIGPLSDWIQRLDFPTKAEGPISKGGKRGEGRGEESP